MNNSFTNTGEMCMIIVRDDNREEGIRPVDIGNYFKDTKGNKVLIMNKEDAIKYNKLVDCPIYIRKKV